MATQDKIIVIKKTVISPNLLPPEAKEELYYNILGETAKKVIQIIALMLILLWGLGGFLLWQMNQEKNDIAANLTNGLDLKKLEELNNISSQIKDLRSINAKIDNSLAKEYHFSDPLAELARLVPKEVVLTSFETIPEQPGWVKIQGSARSRDKFLIFKKGLEESALYEKVESPLSNYVSPESVDFELSVLLKGWQPVWADDMQKKPAAPADTADTKE